MSTQQNDPLVQMLTAVGLDELLIERLRNEAGITSVHDLALTLDDPWQDGSFAAYFKLSKAQVRDLARRSCAELFPKQIRAGKRNQRRPR